jgi:hypothetical protein
MVPENMVAFSEVLRECFTMLYNLLSARFCPRIWVTYLYMRPGRREDAPKPISTLQIAGSKADHQCIVVIAFSRNMEE